MPVRCHAHMQQEHCQTTRMPSLYAFVVFAQSSLMYVESHWPCSGALLWPSERSDPANLLWAAHWLVAPFSDRVPSPVCHASACRRLGRELLTIGREFQPTEERCEAPG